MTTATKKIKYNLGQTTKNTFNKDIALQRLEQFLTFEKRFSKYNTKSIVRGARFLIEHYNVRTPSLDDARHIEEDMKTRGIKNNTIRLRLYDLQYYAESMGLKLEISKPYNAKKAEIQILSVEEARLLLDAALNTRDRAILGVLLYCGLRNKEACNLRVFDVDLKNRWLYVRDHGEGVKNKHERKAVMTSECAIMIKEWLAVRPDVEFDHLFLTTFGMPLSGDRLFKIVVNAAKRAGINEKRVYPHLLRHTCGSMMLKSGVPLTEVALQLGHRSLASTMVYLHGDLATLKDSVDRRFKY